jgi:hypothetical protein
MAKIQIWFCLVKIQIWFCLRSESKAKSSFFFGLPMTMDKPLPSIAIEANFFINRWIYTLTPSKPIRLTRRFPQFVAVASPPSSSFRPSSFFVYRLSMHCRCRRCWAKVHFSTMAGGFHPPRLSPPSPCQNTARGFSPETSLLDSSTIKSDLYKIGCGHKTPRLSPKIPH